MELDPAFYKHLLDHLAEGVYFVDRERRILYWNRGAEAISGYAAEDVIGTRCSDAILEHVDDCMTFLCKGNCPLARAIDSGQPVEKRVFLLHKEGHRIPVDVKVAPVRDEKGEIAGAVEVFSDATAVVQVEKLNRELQKLIHVDPLTRVPNRRALMAALEREFLRFNRYATPISVIFADIDHFKKVNDTLGHTAGDGALQWVARKLSTSVRKTDMVGRYGGEEFVILLPATPPEAAVVTAEHMRAQISTSPCPYTESVITISFGVTAARSGDNISSLLDRADAALYTSKREGRNRVSLR